MTTLQGAVMGGGGYDLYGGREGGLAVRRPPRGGSGWNGGAEHPSHNSDCIGYRSSPGGYDADSDPDQPLGGGGCVGGGDEGRMGGGESEAALLALMERTGYVMLQENGQRKYGPPPDWVGGPPPRGCEVFVGKIPRDCYEDELVPAFEQVGQIYEFRLMMDFSGSNRGYCFVTYTRPEHAHAAILGMNNYEIRPGRYLGVCASVDNCRLFVGGIPKNKRQEEIRQEMMKVTEGVTDVIVYPSSADKSKNRGFAFVEYATHRAAAMARRKLIPGRIQLWGHQIAVDWAEPEPVVDETVMNQVRILYVRNLMLSTSEETLAQIFNEAARGGAVAGGKRAGAGSAVERVKKIRDYAFVHFHERQDALDALRVISGRLNPWLSALLESNGSKVDGSVVEVVLAKPVDRSTYIRYTRAGPQLVTPQGIYPSMDAPPYLPLPSMGGSLTLMPPPPARPPLALGQGHSGGGSFGLGRTGLVGSGHGGAGILGGGVHGTRADLYQEFSRLTVGGGGGIGAPQHSPPLATRAHPGPPLNYSALAVGGGGQGGGGQGGGGMSRDYQERSRSVVKILEELCAAHSWGTPTFTLHSAGVQRDLGTADPPAQRYACTVSLPRLQKAFHSTQLSLTPDSAHRIAAEQALRELTLDWGGGGDAIPLLSPYYPPATSGARQGLLYYPPPPPGGDVGQGSVGGAFMGKMAATTPP